MLPRIRFVAAIIVLALASCEKSAPNPAATPAASIVVSTDSSLYKRLGGYDALAAVTDAFLERLHSDTVVMAFFAGLDSTAMQHIRQMVVDQLCAATGGPCFYAGKSMKDAHATLDITPDAFDKFAGHFQATLVAFKVPQREQGEVMAALASMKQDVVKTP